jgi:hypothetical protein
MCTQAFSTDFSVCNTTPLTEYKKPTYTSFEIGLSSLQQAATPFLLQEYQKNRVAFTTGKQHHQFCSAWVICSFPLFSLIVTWIKCLSTTSSVHLRFIF